MNDRNEENGAMVPMGESLAVSARDQSLVERIQDLLNATEVMAHLQQRILETAVKLTQPEDWIDQGGKPYCSEAGCTRAAAHLPCRSWLVSPPKKHMHSDENGPFYLYVCEAAAAWKTGLGEVSAMGTCSSRDKFFASRGGHLMSMGEVDEPNVVKKCATNGRGNALRRLFGFHGITWERLGALGIDRSKASSVEYDSKKKDENPEQAEKTRAEIGKMIMAMCHDDKDEAAKYLEAMTTFKGKDGKQVPGRKSARHLSEKQAEITLRKVREQYDKYQKATSDVTGSTPGSPDEQLEKDLEGF